MSQACSLSLAACSLIKGRCYRHTGVILQLLQSTNICSFNQARTQKAYSLDPANQSKTYQLVVGRLN